MRIVESARVVSAEGGRARLMVLSAGEGAKCARCPAAGICGRGDGGRTLQADVPPWARPGDEVKVSVEGSSPAWAAFLLFVLPLAVAAAAGLAAYGMAAGPAGGLAASGVGGAAVYVALFLLRSRWRPRVAVLREDAEGP